MGTLAPPLPVVRATGPGTTTATWRRVVRDSVLAWCWSRAAFAVLTVAGVAFYHPTAFQNAPSRYASTLPLTPATLALRWTLWDGGFYLRIAAGNYPYPVDAAFFPLYPLLVRLAHLTPDGSRLSWTVAALVVSSLALLGALVTLGLLAAQEGYAGGPAGSAQRVLLLSPLAFFLSAAYTDGLFLGLAALALLASRRRIWWLATLAAFLAGLTRPTAIILVLPLAWEWWHSTQGHSTQGHSTRGQRGRERWLSGIGLAAAVPLAFAVYAGYCWLHWGDPLAFVHAQAQFGIQAQWPWQTALLVAQQIATNGFWTWRAVRLLVDVLPLVVLLVGTMLGARHRPASFTLYLAGLALLCLCSPVVTGQFPDAVAGAGRFALAAVPLWLDLGRWAHRHPRLSPGLGTASAILQMALLAYVLTGGWLI